MKDNWFVEIVSIEDGDVVKRMGPMSEKRADKVEAGASRNLDHERFYTRMRQEARSSLEQPTRRNRDAG